MKITCENISKAFGAKQVLKDFSVSFETGISCLFGPSGIGKTTLLRILAGLETPDSGEIKGLDDKKISYVFQEDRLLPWLTALENVAIFHGESEARFWLGALDMQDALNLYPRELSGGMKRRVALARALALPYDLILLDEPGRGLNQGLKEKLYEFIREKSEGKIAVLVTHERDESEMLADRYLMVSGLPLKIDQEIEKF